ncbi:hypothetical protein WJX74_000947 [Apatococcus lobatus]|uniref:FMN hydroxy acid dehydrogenase domain-containing protein n=1 Tax=Apatococcus lobatus TaxID=904363 RepID=A0AAW1QT86_9CHLO
MGDSAAKPGRYFSLSELEPQAQERLPKMVYGYYASGADSESTLRDNIQAFKRRRLLPRIMVDVGHVDTSFSLLGAKLKMPVLVAPMAMQQMAHPDGELAVARAAAAAGISMSVSTMATYHLEDVAKAGSACPLLFFQLYVIKDRDFTAKLLQGAAEAGYKGLMVTVDAPHLGHRQADERNQFSLPTSMSLRNLEGLQPKGAHGHSKSSISQVFTSQIDPKLTWDFIAWVRSVSTLPIFVKGVLNPADAHLAVQHGVDGIVVSNHGGRQLDFAPAAVDMLPAIRDAVGRQVPILVDGGVRLGTDIIKAIALGADAVLLGRPVLWGLALEGQQGVEKVLETLRSELELAMALCGAPSLAQITPSLLMGPAARL